ncbi:unnamed protein product [Coffea canephora]|uniref:Uncharacterized protein n=1 Tax=Coffea canephora TaxID=49390 RepID=A0A068V689_COFCA|nr:unnamed protein product [Coffea canephora]
MPTIICFLLIAIAVFLVCGRGHKPGKLPPGPCPLPILGNLFQLGGEKLYHKAVTKLSKVYGPLMSIKLGNQMIFVVSSPNLVREISKKYDHTFNGRIDLDASRALDHHKFSIAWIPSAFEDIITQRLQARGTSPTSGSGKGDLLEVFLDLCQHREAGWSCNDVKHFLLDLFFGATDTTSSTVEWAMVELLRSPDKKEKARAEIRDVIEQGKSVKESDISRLPYLQAVVKETLRLHPPAPILPRKADTDIEVDSYILPKDSLIVFNLWGMGRDSNLWLNPDSFVPERFLNSEIDDKGQHFKLTPLVREGEFVLDILWLSECCILCWLLLFITLIGSLKRGLNQKTWT